MPGARCSRDPAYLVLAVVVVAVVVVVVVAMVMALASDSDGGGGGAARCGEERRRATCIFEDPWRQRPHIRGVWGAAPQRYNICDKYIL